MLGVLLEDEVSKAVGVLLAGVVLVHAAGVAHHVREHRTRERGLRSRHGGVVGGQRLLGPPARARERVQELDEWAGQVIGGAARGLRRGKDLGNLIEFDQWVARLLAAGNDPVEVLLAARDQALAALLIVEFVGGERLERRWQVG